MMDWNERTSDLHPPRLPFNQEAGDKTYIQHGAEYLPLDPWERGHAGKGMVNAQRGMVIDWKTNHGNPWAGAPHHSEVARDHPEIDTPEETDDIFAYPEYHWTEDWKPYWINPDGGVSAVSYGKHDEQDVALEPHEHELIAQHNPHHFNEDERDPNEFML